MSCKYCGNELLSPDADICTKCGKIVEKPRRTENYVEPEKRPSRAWYLVPIFFGIIGGLIMYLVLNDENRRMAKKGLILGIILGAVGTVLAIIIYGVLFGVILNQVVNPHPIANTPQMGTNQPVSTQSYPCNKNLQNSVIPFTANYPPKFVTKWGSFGSGDAQFGYATNIAVDPSGNVYVVDSGGVLNGGLTKVDSRIEKFTNDGMFISKWGSNGSADGKFYTPAGIVVDSCGYVYVADSHNARIQKFTGNGTFVTKWGSSGYGEGQFLYPFSLAIDASGNIFVFDLWKPSIQKFTNNGMFVTEWGSKGSGDGQFDQPSDLAVDPQGFVYVSDRGNNRIQEFSNDGKFIKKWDFMDYDRLGYAGPISIDNNGDFYVTDAEHDRILKYDKNGIFITQWGSTGSNNGQFVGPGRVATDPYGNIFVVDETHGRIEKFSFSTNGNEVNEFTDKSGLSQLTPVKFEINGIQWRVNQPGPLESSKPSFEGGISQFYVSPDGKMIFLELYKFQSASNTTQYYINEQNIIQSGRYDTFANGTFNPDYCYNYFQRENRLIITCHSANVLYTITGSIPNFQSSAHDANNLMGREVETMAKLISTKLSE